MPTEVNTLLSNDSTKNTAWIGSRDPVAQQSHKQEMVSQCLPR